MLAAPKVFYRSHAEAARAKESERYPGTWYAYECSACRTSVARKSSRPYKTFDDNSLDYENVPAWHVGIEGDCPRVADELAKEPPCSGS